MAGVKRDERVKEWIDTNDISVTKNYTTTGTVTGGHLKDTSLTATRVPIVGAGGQLADDADMTFSGSRLTLTDLTVTNSPIISSLTSFRVPFMGLSKEFIDDEDMTFNGSRLYVKSISHAYAIVTDNTVLDSTYHYVKCTASGKTITLPSASGIAGQEYSVDNASTGNLTLACNGAETVEGETTQTLPPGSCLVAVSDGTNWRIT